MQFKAAEARELETSDSTRAENGEFSLAIDLEAALTWFQKAVKGGQHYAQRRLGFAYERGELGVKIDLEVARTWFQEAAEGGDRTSMAARSGLRIWRLGPDGWRGEGAEVAPGGGGGWR